MYALGLGPATPPVGTGQPTPLPAPVTQEQFTLMFDWRANATPSRVFSPPPQPSSLIFAGLTPGAVGLYQVNFLVPSPPGPLLACGDVIQSNLTVNLLGAVSFDGAPICVQASSGAAP